MTRAKLISLIIGTIAAMTCLAGCGSGGASLEKFCQTAEKIDSVNDQNAGNMAAWLKDLVANSPVEVRSDLTYLRDAYIKLDGIEPGDFDKIDQALEGMDVNRLSQLTTDLPDTLQEICAH